MAWHITARMLRTIVAVADAPSMTAAAAQLNVTPSALSHQVRDAEAAARVALFNRTKRRLTLTPLGQQLLASARIILEELDRAEEVLERSRKGEQPVIRLGGGAYPIHRWFLTRRRVLPDAHVDYISRTSNFPLARAVAQGELDIAFAPGETHERGVSALPLFDDDLVAVVSAKHAFGAVPYLEARDLGSGPIHLLEAARPA
ncbi:MAG: LysR family transcriptional regulator [Paracoccaceae bacterium]